MLQTEIIADLDSLNEENVLLTYQLPLSKRPIMAENKSAPFIYRFNFHENFHLFLESAIEHIFYTIQPISFVQR